jgi:hypothetical protein
MKILVAGKDRSSDIGAEIKDCAASLKKLKAYLGPKKVSPEIGALALHQAKSDADYLNHFIRLLRYRDAFDTYDFAIPRKPGMIGSLAAFFKRLLWKIMRYQYDRIAFRQNLINGLFTNAIEFEIIERQRACDALSKRLDQLETKLK